MPAHPDEVVWIVRQLAHTKGKFAGQPFVLKPWQEAWIRAVTALDRRGRRKVQRALLGIARKNGKSELIAALAIALMIADREPGGEIVGAAAKRDQARIILEASKRMVRYSRIGGRRLSDFIIERRDGLFFPEMDTRYIVVSADGEREHGLNPHIVLFDELHAQGQKRDLWDALVTAQGAREDPLMLSISTAGPMPKGVCWSEYEYARKVNGGLINDPTFHGLWYEADRELEVDDPEAWRQANPGYEGPDAGFVSHDFLERQARDVLAGKLSEYTFRRLHLNQWTTALERWLPRKQWESCFKSVVIPEGAEVVIGIDAAVRRDSFGVAMVHKQEAWVQRDDGLTVPAPVAHCRAWAFTPAEEGEYIDLEDIRTHIMGLAARYTVAKVLYDPAYMGLFAQQLAEAGLQCEPYPQSAEKMVLASETFQRLVLDDRLRWQDKILDEHLAAIGTKPTERGVRISKAKSGEHTDTVFALVPALQELFGDEGDAQEDFAFVV